MSNYILTSNGELYHYGIKGMKWGVRRYQNKDGSLTPAGKKRHSTRTQSNTKKEAIARELSENATTMKGYVKAIKMYGDNSPQAITARKRVKEQDGRIRKQVIDYLKSLPEQEAYDLVKFDTEHGRHYVELKVFDEKYTDYDDGIYID